MPIRVRNEIMPLKKVLLHRPGRELEHIVPDAMDRLLFDDIPYLGSAQAEHDCFARLLREHGAEVVYLEDLTAEVLRSQPALRELFVRDLIAGSGSLAQAYGDAIRERLLSIPDEKELVLTAMAGLPFSELELKRGRLLHELLGDATQFALEPTPNLYFTRDTFASIGSGAALNHMHSAVRNRETVYARYVLRYHPDFAGSVPLYYTPDEPFSIEGGDILNLSPTVLVVGVSQRTVPEAVERLARNIFADEAALIRTVVAVSIPARRAFMHLDTVLTQISRTQFVVHPGILESLRLVELTPDRGGEVRVRELNGSLARVLSDYLGCEAELILCGGSNEIISQREQWNDGANTLCLAPGSVVTYDRNYVTNRILQEHGIEVHQIPSGELSRGRGGPRCMSMPLIRETEE